MPFFFFSFADYMVIFTTLYTCTSILESRVRESVYMMEFFALILCIFIVEHFVILDCSFCFPLIQCDRNITFQFAPKLSEGYKREEMPLETIMESFFTIASFTFNQQISRAKCLPECLYFRFHPWQDLRLLLLLVLTFLRLFFQ